MAAVYLGAVYQSHVYASTDNTVTLPDFTRVDAALFYTFMPRLRAQVNVENLLDRRYWATANSNNNITPAAPRAVRVTMSTSF